VRESLEQVVTGAQIELAAATASSALEVARDAACYLRPGQVYVGLNSVPPETKQKIGAELADSGADFVEAAVMVPVKPTRFNGFQGR
jgi:3-hydroxyisobutyrate dehydrogenase-like beta-hydroxyacid dehydrogenase